MRGSLLLLLCGVAAVSCTLSEEDYQKQFVGFVAQYGKQYAMEEVFHRYNVFKASVDFVAAHNDGAKSNNQSYTLGLNEFADLTWAEFRSTRLNVVARDGRTPRLADAVAPVHSTAPSSIDWVALGKVTAVKNQGSCGSCWAFSCVGAVESAHAIASGQLVQLSEQQLVDCAGPYGNYGCDGGLMDYGFEYVVKKGLCSAGSYPYSGHDGTCKDNQCTAAAHIAGYADVPSGNEDSLLDAVATTPVAVAIEADQAVFQFYKSGIIDGACGSALDHGVLTVGYGTDSGKDYWKVKNSWGTSWGEAGYVRIVRHKNMCGINLEASYPTGASL